MKTYCNLHVTASQASSENTDDHSAYIDYVRQHNWQSYICKSFHLYTVDEYFEWVKAKMDHATVTADQDQFREVFNETRKTLDKKIAGVKGKTSACSLVKYLIRVIWSSSGEILDASHLQYGSEQNLGLHGLVEPAAVTRITWKEKILLFDGWGKGHIEHRFCPFCSYSSSSHWAISNHIRAHLRLAMFCGYCYYVSLSTKDMLNHGKVHVIKHTAPLRPEKKD